MPTDAPATPRSRTAGATVAVPGAGQRRRRAPRRTTAATVVPVALAVLAAAFAYESLQDRSAMRPIVVARVFVPTGAVVDAVDTRLVSVHAADEAATRGLWAPSQLGPGWVAAVPLQPGEPVTESEVTRPRPGPPLGQMSIPVPADQAVGGALSPGDLVDVIGPGPDGGAHYVAQGLRVVSVAGPSAMGVLGGGSGGYFVIVDVNKAAALRVAAALGDEGAGAAAGGLELVRSTGEPQSDASPVAGAVVSDGAPGAG